MKKIIDYTRKNGDKVEVDCSGVKGSILYVLIKFCNWVEKHVVD